MKSTGYLRVVTNGGIAVDTTSTTQPMTANNWYLITLVTRITGDAGTTKVYVNSTEVMSRAHGTDTYGESNPLRIGSVNVDGTATFQGSIGAMYAYSTSLSAAAITDNYNATSA